MNICSCIEMKTIVALRIHEVNHEYTKNTRGGDISGILATLGLLHTYPSISITN